MVRLSAVIAVLILVALCGTAAEAYVIQPEELEEIIKNIETYPNLVIIDVRGAEDYANGHIPGAINIYWKSFRDEKGVLLPVTEVADILGENGITNTNDIILYDDRGGSEASYVFWMLDYLGHKGNISVLNGSVSKVWKGNFSTEEVKRSPTSYEVDLKPETHADTEWVKNHLDDPNVIFVDTRSSDEYTGKKIKGDDPRGGHIPGAINLNYEDLWANKETKTLKSVEELSNIFSEKGLDKDKEIVVYCHSGRRASFVYYALKLVGYDKVRNYDESMVIYSAKLDLPLENETFREGVTPTTTPTPTPTPTPTTTPTTPKSETPEEEPTPGFTVISVIGALAAVLLLLRRR